MLRYYLHIDPSDMTDNQWAQTAMQLADIRRREASDNSKAPTNSYGNQ